MKLSIALLAASLAAAPAKAGPVAAPRAAADILDARCDLEIFFARFKPDMPLSKALLGVDSTFWQPILGSQDLPSIQTRLGPLGLKPGLQLALQVAGLGRLSERRTIALARALISAKLTAAPKVEAALRARMRNVPDTIEGWSEFQKLAEPYADFSPAAAEIYRKAGEMTEELRELEVQRIANNPPFHTAGQKVVEPEAVPGLLRRAVIDDDPEAQSLLAEAHNGGNGKTTAPLTQAALKWHLRAARLEENGHGGNPHSLLRLAQYGKQFREDAAPRISITVTDELSGETRIFPRFSLYYLAAREGKRNPGKWESLLREAQSLLHVITAAQYREAVQQLKGPSLADEARAALAKRPPTPLEKFSELDAQRREKELSKFVLTVGLVMGLMGFPFWVTGAGNLLVFAALVFFVVLGLTIDAVSSIGASRRIADLIRHRMNPQRPAASDGNAGNGGVL